MKILSALLILCTTTVAGARVATLAEVPLLVKKLERETVVNEDGTFRDRWSWRMKVQRRDAREDSGTRSIRFYKSFEEVKVLRAGTRTEGKFKEISLKDLQERAVTDESPGFSSLHEYVLSFPDVQEGSEIEFDYEVRTKRALEEGFWGQSFILDTGAYESFQWKIRSQRPLADYAQDPQGMIEGSRRKEGAGETIVYRSKAPFSLALADESEPYVSNRRKIILMAGFLSDWARYGRSSSKEFEKLAQESMPAEDEAFAVELRKEPDHARRVQKVLQRMHEKLRYFGDWRASEHMYVPRPFAEIARTQYGDCKDFALVAVRLLRLAGLEAKPVWILNTEDPPSENLYKIPTDNAFNHVIVRVGDDKNFWWVDPTNTAARVNYIADEIAGRPGLVLDAVGSRLIPIRRIEPADYRTVVEATAAPGRRGRTRLSVKAGYRGYSPISAGEQMESDGLTYFIEEHLQRLMPAASLGGAKTESVDVDRETGDLRAYKASAEFENFWVRTSLGLGYSPVREEIIEKLRNLKLSDRGGDVLLGKVYAYEETLRLTGYRLQGRLKLDCEVRSPWLDFTQRVREERDAVVFQSIFSLKEPDLVLTPETRPGAARLQKDLRDCAGRVLVLLKKIPAAKVR